MPFCSSVLPPQSFATSKRRPIKTAEYRRVQVRRPQGKLERIPERLNKVGLQEEDFKVYMPFKGQAAKEPNTAFKLTDTIKMSKRDLKG